MKKVLIFIALLYLTSTLVAQEKERTFQFSLVTPLGTNWTDSHLYTNIWSLNLIGGYSYANKAVELGGLYNFNSGFTQGFQAAGLLNYTGNSVNAFQLAGFANLSLSGNSSLQLAGIGNLGENTTGLQGAGIINIGANITGVQVAGVMNFADYVTGIQIAPTFNIAKSVKGVQVGLVNYAEDIDGVQIGLINVVENGGKQEIEISSSEVLHGVISFKLGTDTLYTIFSSGTYFLNYDFEYGAGIGFGTQLNWNNGWNNQIEAIHYAISRDASFETIPNSLNQVKLLTSKNLIGGLNIFAGPVFNLEILYKYKVDGSFGESIAPWVFWNVKNEQNHFNMWVGFNVGLSYRL